MYFCKRQKIPLLFVALIVLFGFLPSQSISAKQKFLTLRYAKSHLRSGNSKDHPIVATYTRKGLPFEVLDVFHQVERKDDGSKKDVPVWYRVKDYEGQTGWMHYSQFSRDPFLLVLPKTADDEVPMYTQPDMQRTHAYLPRYLIVRRERCDDVWCVVIYKDKTHGELKGYVNPNFLWGNIPE